LINSSLKGEEIRQTMNFYRSISVEASQSSWKRGDVLSLGLPLPPLGGVVRVSILLEARRCSKPENGRIGIGPGIGRLNPLGSEEMF
jgi:hypothetical protein